MFSPRLWQVSDKVSWSKTLINTTISSPLRAPPPIRARPVFWDQISWLLDVLVKSQPKMVRFSFCKKPLESGNVLYRMGATLRSCLSARHTYWRIYGIPLWLFVLVVYNWIYTKKQYEGELILLNPPVPMHGRLYAPRSVCMTPVTRLKVLEKIHIITARHVVPKLILVNTWMSPRST